MQETRLRQGGYQKSNGFHILSATAQGQYGVSLCVRDTIGTEARAISVGCTHLHILAASPRHLIVRFQHPDLRLLLIVAHVPIDDHCEAAQRFWSQVNGDIPTTYHAWTTIALIDANAKLGSVTASSVGSHQADEQNSNGLALHSWLQRNDLFLPQTFEGCHQGAAATWTHANGSLGRIDFFAVSSNVQQDVVTTYVDEDVDLQVSRADHKCVVAKLQLLGTPAASVDHSLDRDLATRSETSALDTNWCTNVHDHAAILQASIAGRFSPASKPRKRKPHLSDETWTLIQNKKWHLAQSRHCDRVWRLGMLRTIFHAWRSPTTNVPSQHDRHKDCMRKGVWHQHQIHLLTQQVKQACRQDDSTFYEKLAFDTAQRTHDSPSSVWDAIRPLLPKTRKKRATSLKCDGPSPSERCSYYAELEAGTFQPFHQALAQCHDQQLQRIHEAPLQASVAHMPSRVTIEKLCNNVRTGRASGLDGIAPEVLKHHNVDLAENISDLMIKIWLTSAEPFQFKGGRLHSIVKRHASKRVEDLRGIMILDGLG